MPDRFRQPPSTLDRDGFVVQYGGVYEHSPHFVQSVWPQAADGALDILDGLADALSVAVNQSGHAAQLALIRAHPDLANKLRAAPLTAASSAEQAGAGL